MRATTSGSRLGIGTVPLVAAIEAEDGCLLRALALIILEGCVAPIIGVILILGSIAIFAFVPAWGLAVLLVVLLVSIPLVILLAVRSVRRKERRRAEREGD